jgi:hypothetical protein
MILYMLRGYGMQTWNGVQIGASIEDEKCFPQSKSAVDRVLHLSGGFSFAPHVRSGIHADTRNLQHILTPDD